MIVKFLAVVLVIVPVCDIAGYITEKPDFIPVTCHKKDNDKDYVKCATQSVQTLFDRIRDGVPELHLAPTDPLLISRIDILEGDGPVSVTAHLRNVTVRGFNDTRILYNRVDPKTYKMITKLMLPSLRIEGDYEMHGRILVLPIRGSGKCWFQTSNMSIDLRNDINLVKRDNFHFYDVINANVNYVIGDLKMHMGNLFDGLKTLEKTTNDFLNENWRPASESLRPVLKTTIEQIILDILKKIFHNVPADFFVDDIADPV